VSLKITGFSEVDVVMNTILNAQTGILLEDTADALFNKNVIADGNADPSEGDIAILCDNSSATVRGNNTIAGYSILPEVSCP